VSFETLSDLCLISAIRPRFRLYGGANLYSIGAMTTASADQMIRKILATALMIFPCAFILVFILHFRHLARFFEFHLTYVPRDPERVVTALIAGHNRWPLLHDPHMIAYLSLPVIPLCAFALYLLGRRSRPLASAATLMITMAGMVYMGGLFGMWTAFYRGLGLLDPSNLAGATATFAAMTAPQGAFLVTTWLAKLVMVGLAAQALTLLGTRVTPAWSIICVVLGCSMILVFWDLDNWMLIGSVLMLTGFLPMRKALLEYAENSERSSSE
jgi:hypothetical protein